MAASKRPPGTGKKRRRSDAPPSSKPSRPKSERTPRAPREPNEATASRWPLPLRICLVVTALVVGGAAAFIYLVYPSRKHAGDGHDVELAIPGDESVDALAERLNAAGLLDDPRFFALYLRAQGGAGQIARGTHLVPNDLTPSDLVSRLARRPWRTRAKVTFPEGWTRFDMARRLQSLGVCAQAPFLAATKDPTLLAELKIPGETAEGYLFPATYELPADSDPADVVRKLKAELDKRYARLLADHPGGADDLQKTLGWGQKEIVTLASIVEKEAAAADERSLVASVFLNRLRDPSWKRKILQTDPTSGYGCLNEPEVIPACAGYTGKITHDINMDPANRWSTYTHEGLPPGPIANPGERSLEAVLAPATTHYFYFFARGGQTTFSETYDAHNQVVHAH